MEKFVGREEELQILRQLLQENNRVAIAAIAGMGGVGKTELALQYAMTHCDIYIGGICWLSPKSGDLGIQIVQFARTYLDLNPPDDLDLPARVQYCWARWRESDVLLVLDDVSEYEQVKPYLPSSISRFKVLMTSRQRLGKISQLSLDVLQPEAALELLVSIIGTERITKENDLTPQPPSLRGKGENDSPLLVGEGLGERSYSELVALQLCEWLGYLPLGVELVGRYLARKPDLSLAEMLQRLKKQRLEQRALEKPEADMTAQRGVLAAFELSWQELEDEDQQLGCLLSLFAAAPIPWKLVEQCLPEKDEEDLEDIRDDKLLNLHLLQRKDEGIYQLHPLLREFFQYKLTGLEQAEEFKRSFCEVMIAVAEDILATPTLQKIKDFAPAIPHLAEVANNFIQYVSDDHLIGPFIGNAQFYYKQGLYDKAVPWCEQCLAITKKRLGEEHPYVELSLNYLTLLYRSQGRYSEAEPLYIQALAMTRKLLGEEHRYVALSLNNLALLYLSQGRYSEAEPLYIQSLAMTRKLLGEEHRYVALSLNNLALLYLSQGRYSEAEPLYIQALALSRKLQGAEHPSVAISLNNLALLYYYQDNYKEAEKFALQAIELDKQLLGSEHPDFATDLHNLGLIYSAQRRYKEAEKIFLQVLELKQRLLPNEHPLLADTIYGLGSMYKKWGRYKEAEPLCIKALELDKQLLGEKHPNYAKSLSNLADLYCVQSRYNEAEPLYIQALYIFERQLGVNHPDTVTVRKNLADLRDALQSQQ